MIEVHTPSLGNAAAGWVLLSTLYALFVRSPFKINPKQDAHYYDGSAQIHFKKPVCWLHPRGSIAITNRDLLLFTNRWVNTLLLFGAFDTPLIIPREKILSTRTETWFFGFVPIVEVEYDNAGEREVVQLWAHDSDRLLLMLANTRSVANEQVGDDEGKGPTWRMK